MRGILAAAARSSPSASSYPTLSGRVRSTTTSLLSHAGSASRASARVLRRATARNSAASGRAGAPGSASRRHPWNTRGSANSPRSRNSHRPASSFIDEETGVPVQSQAWRRNSDDAASAAAELEAETSWASSSTRRQKPSAPSGEKALEEEEEEDEEEALVPVGKRSPRSVS